MEPNLDEKENVVKGRRRSSILKQTRSDFQLDFDSNQSQFNKENVTGGYTKSCRRVSFADEVRARVYEIQSPYSGTVLEARARSLKPNKTAAVEDTASLKPKTDLAEPEKPSNSIIKMDIQKHLFDKHYILSSPSKRPLQELQNESAINAVSENVKLRKESEAAVSFDHTKYEEVNMDLTAESMNLDTSVYFHPEASDMSLCTVSETPNVSLIGSAPETQPQPENLCDSMELTEDTSGKIVELSPQKNFSSNINCERGVASNFADSSENVEQQDPNNSDESSLFLPLGGHKPSFLATSTGGGISGFTENPSLINHFDSRTDDQKVEELQDSSLEADELEVSNLISAPKPSFIKKSANVSDINEDMEVSLSQPLFGVIQADEAIQDNMSLVDNDLEVSYLVSADKPAFIKEKIEESVKASEVSDRELEVSLRQPPVPLIQTNEAMQDLSQKSCLDGCELKVSGPGFIKEHIDKTSKVPEVSDMELEISLSQSLFPVMQFTNEAKQDSPQKSCSDVCELEVPGPGFIKERIDKTSKVPEVSDMELEISLSQSLFPVMQDSPQKSCLDGCELEVPGPEFIKERIDKTSKVPEVSDMELEVSLSQSLFPVMQCCNETTPDSPHSLCLEASKPAFMKESMETTEKVYELDGKELEVSFSQPLLPAIQNDEALQNSRLRMEENEMQDSNLISAPKPAFIEQHIKNTLKLSEINDAEMEILSKQSLLPATETHEAMQDSCLEELEVSNLISAPKPAFIKQHIENTVKLSDINDAEIEILSNQSLLPVIEYYEAMHDSNLISAPKPASIKQHFENTVKLSEAVEEEKKKSLSQLVIPVVQADEAMQDPCIEENELCASNFIFAPQAAFINDQSPKGRNSNNEMLNLEESMDLTSGCDARFALKNDVENSEIEKIELRNCDEMEHISKESTVKLKFLSAKENESRKEKVIGSEKNAPLQMQNNSQFDKIEHDEPLIEFEPMAVQNTFIKVAEKLVMNTLLEKEKVKTCLEMPSTATERDINLTLFSTSRNMFFQAPVSEASMNVTPVFPDENNMGRTLQMIQSSPLHLEEINLQCADISFTVEKLKDADKSVLNISQISEQELLLHRSPEKSQIAIAAPSAEAKKGFADPLTEKTLIGEEDICSKTFAVTVNKTNRISKNDRRLTYILEELRKDKTFVKDDVEKSIIHEDNVELPLHEISSSQNLKTASEVETNEKLTPRKVNNSKPAAGSKSKAEIVPKLNSTVEKRETRSKSKDKKREVSRPASEASPVPKKRSRVKNLIEIPKSTKVVIPTKVSLPKIGRSLEQRCSRLMTDSLAEPMHSTLHSSNISNSSRRTSISSCSEPKKRKLLYASSSSFETSSIISNSTLVNRSKEKPFEVSNNEVTIVPISSNDITRYEKQNMISNEQTLVAEPDQPQTALTVLSSEKVKECGGNDNNNDQSSRISSKKFKEYGGKNDNNDQSSRKLLSKKVKECGGNDNNDQSSKRVKKCSGNNEQSSRVLVPPPGPCGNKAEELSAKTIESAKPSATSVLTQVEVTKSKVTKLNELRLQVFGVQEENKKLSVLTPDSEKEKILRMLDDAIEKNRMERIRGRKAVTNTINKCEELDQQFKIQKVEIQKDLDKSQYSLARWTFGSPKQERGLLEIVVKSWSTSNIHVQIWTSAIEIHAVLGNEVEKPEFGPWNVLDNRVIESVDRLFNIDGLKSNNFLEFAHQLLWDYQNSMGHLLNTCKTSYDFIAILKIIGEATYRAKMVFQDLEWIRDSDKHKFQLDGSQLTVWFTMPAREAEFVIVFNLGLEMYSKDGGGISRENCTKSVFYKHIRGVTGEDKILSAVDSITWGDFYIKKVIRAVDRWVYFSKWYA